MKNARNLLTGLLVMVMMVVLLSGCSSKPDSSSNTSTTTSTSESTETSDSGNTDATLDTSKQVELVLYVMGTEPNKQQEMNDNLNKLLLEKFNCTLKINWVGWSDYANKYPLLFSSGEEFDIAYAASWLNFPSLAQKGAFMNLDDLWPTYAPDNFALQSDTAKSQATIDGHYYAVPTLFASYSAYGPIYRTDIMEGTEWNGEMNNFEDVEAYLDIVKANNPELEPLEIYSSGSEVDEIFIHYNSIYPSKGATNDFLFLDPKEENPTFFTYYEFEKTPDFLDMMARWNQKGFYPKSALSDTDPSKTQNGKAAIRIHNIDTYQGYYIDHPEWKFKFSNFATDISNMSFTQDAMVISNTSKHPELAMAVYNYLTTDEEAYRAFQWGIEGTSYRITENNQLEMLNTDDFAQSSMWSARNSQFHLETAGSPADIKELKAEFDKRIKDGVGIQKYRSFVIDTSSIETEYAACQNVHQQYWWPLELGYTDVKTGLEEYKQKMQAAGVDKVKEVLQQQLNEYVANQK